MDLISIIVPVYNVENYIKECIDSIINQSYKNIEIILVDDGSTDNSGSLCEEFSFIDSRIITLHKENGGLSDARNYGIKHSNGEYIMFVDSDDVIDKDIVKVLYNLIHKDKAIDISGCGLKRFNDGHSPKFMHRDKYSILDREDSLKEFLYQKKISTSSCGKLYRRSVMENIFFIKNQRFEDNEFVFRVLLNADKVAVSESELYAYRYRQNSITTSSFDEKDFDIIDIGKMITGITNNLNENLRIAGITYQCTNCLRIYLNISDRFTSYDEYKYCLKYLYKYSNIIISKSQARIKLKIALILYKLNFPLHFFKKVKSRIAKD